MSITQYKVKQETVNDNGSVDTCEPVYHTFFIGALIHVFKIWYNYKKNGTNSFRTITIERVLLG